jgi:ribosomal protein L11 methyltransferase
MHLWRKIAGARWVELHETELDALSGGNVAIITRPGRTRAEIEICCRTSQQARKLAQRFGGSAKLLAKDWQRKLIAPTTRAPIRVGKRLLIVADESSRRRAATANPHRRVLVIPAGLAFGTGEHVTTAMCLRLLEQVSRSLPARWTMLDAGTGSGVLALAARFLGARSVSAFDNDARAVATAKQNASLNNITGIRFARADVLAFRDTATYDVITANLFSELVIAALPGVKQQLKRGGYLIVSGALRRQETGVLRALRDANFTTLQVRRRGRWTALLCTTKCAAQTQKRS